MKISDYWQHFYSSLGNAKKRKAIGRWLRMHFYIRFPRNSPEKIKKLHKELAKDSRWKTDFIVCTVIACLIASFGLLSNSTAVIIGAMLVAPLMLPLRGLSFATLEGDIQLLRSSLSAIALGTIIAIGCSWLVGLVIGLPQFGSEIWSRTEPTLIDLLIAIVAGGISGYAKIRPAMSDAIPGTAISVALMPPLCVIGLTLSQGQWEAARSLGLNSGLAMRMVVFPQALRVIIPPLNSEFMNLAKNSSLALAIGYPDLYSIANTTFNQTGRPVEVFLLMMATYLIINLLISVNMNQLNNAVQFKER